MSHEHAKNPPETSQIPVPTSLLAVSSDGAVHGLATLRGDDEDRLFRLHHEREGCLVHEVTVPEARALVALFGTRLFPKGTGEGVDVGAEVVVLDAAAPTHPHTGVVLDVVRVGEAAPIAAVDARFALRVRVRLEDGREVERAAAHVRLLHPTAMLQDVLTDGGA